MTDYYLSNLSPRSFEQLIQSLALKMLAPGRPGQVQQKPEGTRRDGQWLIEQLRADLKKFKDKKKQLIRPEYYLLCTNVALSSVARKGAKDAAFELFSQHQL
jgi:hypothetical protein